LSTPAGAVERQTAGHDRGQYANFNAIPIAALQRLELLKDGASPTYGSDAIAGFGSSTAKQSDRHAHS
jgi:iron complex outermembrane receptor protein